MRARYYAPDTGRFITADNREYQKEKEPLSLNLYTYCHNDPVNGWDPSGNCVAVSYAYANSSYESRLEADGYYWNNYCDFLETNKNPTLNLEHKLLQTWYVHGFTWMDANIAYDFTKDDVQWYAKGIIQHGGLGVKEIEKRAKSEPKIKNWFNSIKNKIKSVVGGPSRRTASPQAQASYLNKFVSNPKKLKGFTPASLYKELKSKGIEVNPLNKGSFKGTSYEEGGGYKVNWGGDKLLSYHPDGRGHHGKGAYWKISPGGGDQSPKRYNMDGTPRD